MVAYIVVLPYSRRCCSQKGSYSLSSSKISRGVYGYTDDVPRTAVSGAVRRGGLGDSTLKKRLNDILQALGAERIGEIVEYLSTRLVMHLSHFFKIRIIDHQVFNAERFQVMKMPTTD